MVRRSFLEAPLFMTLVLWLCTLPAVLLIAPLFVSWRVTWYLAAALLVAELLACWVMCRLPPWRDGAEMSEITRRKG